MGNQEDLVTIAGWNKSMFPPDKQPLIEKDLIDAFVPKDGMAADMGTAMQRAISETNRRRVLQRAYNEEHGIDPQSIRKAVTDILSFLRPSQTAPTPGDGQRNRRRDHVRISEELANLAPDELGRLILTLEEEMQLASADLRFEYAARLRDEIKELKRERRDAS